MILFMNNSIMSSNASYLQNLISFQRICIPNGASRNVPYNFRNTNDPAFPDYWYQKQEHVRAMCAHFSDPDLMVTFTFVNKWPEVKRTEDKINGIGFDNLDIRFCPFEEMAIWKERFEDIKNKGFNDLINNMNFGEVAEYCWRLEFQARGAPHVHALIWLKSRLFLENINNNFFAHIPSRLLLPKLYQLITSSMIHVCTLARCQKGI